MKKLLFLLFIFSFGMSQSQNKQELMHEIIKHNIVESNCVGIGCSPSEQYTRFQNLKKLLTKNELLELSNHENPVIRSYTFKELVKSHLGNLPYLLNAELQRKEEVETFEGCIMDSNPTSSILYHAYWNKIRLEAIQIGNDYEKEQASIQILKTDEIMKQLDSVIIHSNEEVYWLLYHRAFENRKYEDSYLPSIEKLAFQQNNFFAFEYLSKHHEVNYRDRLHNYLIRDFLIADFEGENGQTYFHSFIEYLLIAKKVQYRDIIIQKLKSRSKDIKIQYYIKNLLNKSGIDLDKLD